MISMQATVYELGSDAVTIWTFTTSQEYRGQTIYLQGDYDSCPSGEHEIEVMHHYGDNGEHFCPTGFVMCRKCGAVGDEPKPYECNIWRE